MTSPTPIPQITLFALPQSRALRIAWLLEELSLPYSIITGSRLPNFDADPAFKAQCGGLGKSPTIHDGAIVIQESGAIVDYLIETYPSSDPMAPLIPPMSSPAARAKVREFMHLAEGSFFLHAYPVFMSRRLPTHLLTSVDVHELRIVAAQKVFADMDWLETHLAETKTTFLVGEHVTAADIMMALSAQMNLERIVKVGGISNEGDGREYPSIEKWLGGLMGRKALRVAMMKTGFT